MHYSIFLFLVKKKNYSSALRKPLQIQVWQGICDCPGPCISNSFTKGCLSFKNLLQLGLLLRNQAIQLDGTMPCGCGPTSHPDEKGASVMSFLMSDMRVYFAVCVFQSPSHSQHVGVVFEADPHQHPHGGHPQISLPVEIACVQACVVQMVLQPRLK